MRAELNIFVDPESKRPLSLKEQIIREGHVLEGKLCSRSRDYHIIRGIPRFVSPDFYKEYSAYSGETQTAKSFGKKWCEKRTQRLGFSKQDVKNLTEQFMAILGCQTSLQLKDLLGKAKRTLNAGCGVAWPEYLFNYYNKTERHCIDFSPAVETAYCNTKRLKNVIVSQASIFDLPYKNGTFDIIYSLGVLHHTSNPRAAFFALSKKLMPRGLIGIYIYNKKPFLREIADEKIRKITTKMSYNDCMKFARQMSNLGRSLNKLTETIHINENIGLLGIKKGKYKAQRFIYDFFLKCWYSPKEDLDYANLVNQDWYHPHYASHHKKEEIMGWFKDAGMVKIKCFQPRGWEYSGYFISGIKK